VDEMCLAYGFVNVFFFVVLLVSTVIVGSFSHYDVDVSK